MRQAKQRSARCGASIARTPTNNLKLNTDHKGCIEHNLRNINIFIQDFRVRPDEVYDAIERQRCCKAAGVDDIQADHLIYASRIICVILAMSYVIHNVLLPRMIWSIMVPIVKFNEIA